MNAVLVDTAAERFVELSELTDEKIEAAIIVIVEPDRAGAPSPRSDPGFIRHVGKRAVTVIVIENVVTYLRDVEIGKAIAVIVTHGNSHAITAAGDPSFLSDISEAPIAIVAVERVTQRPRRIIEMTLAAVDQVDVHPTVVVEVEEVAAGSAGFRQMLFSRLACRVYPLNAAACWKNFLEGIYRS